MRFKEELKEVLRNKPITKVCNSTYSIEDWITLFLDFYLPIDRIEESLEDIEIITKDFIYDDDYLFYCEQFKFRGKILYEKFIVAENLGDWSENEEFDGPDHSYSLQKELARYVVNYYMDRRY